MSIVPHTALFVALFALLALRPPVRARSSRPALAAALPTRSPTPSRASWNWFRASRPPTEWFGRSVT